LIQQVPVRRKFILEYFRRAGILAETAIRAAAVYGRARIKRDGVLRADFQATPAIALSEPYPLAITGKDGNIPVLVQCNIQEISSGHCSLSFFRIR
jgi:hypothetical protein